MRKFVTTKGLREFGEEGRRSRVRAVIGSIPSAGYHSGGRESIDNCEVTERQESGRGLVAGRYCSFAYSDLAARRMGMSGSASFHSVRKSW